MGCGILIALLLLLFRGAIADYLNLPDPTLVALLAFGAAFYIPLGCRRGYIQGAYGFRRLATNLVVEERFGSADRSVDTVRHGRGRSYCSQCRGDRSCYLLAGPELTAPSNPLRFSAAFVKPPRQWSSTRARC